MDTLGLFIFLLLQIISIAACSWFLYCYRKFSKMTVALKMISTLNLTNLVFHLVTFLIFIQDYPHEHTIPKPEGIAIGVILRFSVFWSCSIVFVVYRSILRNGKIHSETYLKLSVVFVIILTIGFTVL